MVFSFLVTLSPCRLADIAQQAGGKRVSLFSRLGLLYNHPVIYTIHAVYVAGKFGARFFSAALQALPDIFSSETTFIRMLPLPCVTTFLSFPRHLPGLGYDSPYLLWVHPRYSL